MTATMLEQVFLYAGPQNGISSVRAVFLQFTQHFTLSARTEISDVRKLVGVAVQQINDISQCRKPTSRKTFKSAYLKISFPYRDFSYEVHMPLNFLV